MHFLILFNGRYYVYLNFKLFAKLKKLKNRSPRTLRQRFFFWGGGGYEEEALKFAPGHEKVTNVMR